MGTTSYVATTNSSSSTTRPGNVISGGITITGTSSSGVTTSSSYVGGRRVSTQVSTLKSSETPRTMGTSKYTASQLASIATLPKGSRVSLSPTGELIVIDRYGQKVGSSGGQQKFTKEQLTEIAKLPEGSKVNLVLPTTTTQTTTPPTTKEGSQNVLFGTSQVPSQIQTPQLEPKEYGLPFLTGKPGELNKPFQTTSMLQVQPQVTTKAPSKPKTDLDILKEAPTVVYGEQTRVSLERPSYEKIGSTSVTQQGTIPILSQGASTEAKAKNLELQIEEQNRKVSSYNANYTSSKNKKDVELANEQLKARLNLDSDLYRSKEGVWYVPSITTQKTTYIKNPDGTTTKVVFTKDMPQREGSISGFEQVKTKTFGGGRFVDETSQKYTIDVAKAEYERQTKGIQAKELERQQLEEKQRSIIEQNLPSGEGVNLILNPTQALSIEQARTTLTDINIQRAKDVSTLETAESGFNAAVRDAVQADWTGKWQNIIQAKVESKDLGSKAAGIGLSIGLGLASPVRDIIYTTKYAVTEPGKILTSPRAMAGALDLAFIGIGAGVGYAKGVSGARTAFMSNYPAEAISKETLKGFGKQVLINAGLTVGIPTILEAPKIISGKESISMGLANIGQSAGYMVGVSGLTSAAAFGGARVGQAVENARINRQILEGLPKAVSTESTKVLTEKFPEGSKYEGKSSIQGTKEVYIQTKDYGVYKVRLKGGTNQILSKEYQPGMRILKSESGYYIEGGVNIREGEQMLALGKVTQGRGAVVATKGNVYLTKEGKTAGDAYLRDVQGLSKQEIKEFYTKGTIRGQDASRLLDTMKSEFGLTPTSQLKGFSGTVIEPTTGKPKFTVGIERQRISGRTVEGEKSVLDLPEIKINQKIEQEIISAQGQAGYKTPVTISKEMATDYIEGLKTGGLIKYTPEDVLLRYGQAKTGTPTSVSNVVVGDIGKTQYGSVISKGYGSGGAVERLDIVRTIGKETQPTVLEYSPTKLILVNGKPSLVPVTKGLGKTGSLGTVGQYTNVFDYTGLGDDFVGRTKGVSETVIPTSATISPVTSIDTSLSSLKIGGDVTGTLKYFTYTKPTTISPILINPALVGIIPEISSMSKINQQTKLNINTDYISKLSTTLAPSSTLFTPDVTSISGGVYEGSTVFTPSTTKITGDISFTNNIVESITSTPSTTTNIFTTTPTTPTTPPITPFIPTLFIPAFGLPSFGGLPGTKTQKKQKLGFLGNWSEINPIADERIFFKKSFGYYGDVTGATRTIDVLGKIKGIDFGSNIKKSLR